VGLPDTQRRQPGVQLLPPRLRIRSAGQRDRAVLHRNSCLCASSGRWTQRLSDTCSISTRPDDDRWNNLEDLSNQL